MELLEQLSQIAPLLSFITIIVAIIFGVVQLKQFKTNRKDIAAVEIMRSFQNRDFTDSIILINDLPEGISLKEIREKDGKYESAILALTTKFETLGFLISRKVIPVEYVEQLVGGECVRYWKKLENYVLEFRKVEEQKIFLEWFEWLAKKFISRERQEDKPAIERMSILD